MIRDFFLILVIVAIIEFGVKFGLVLYNFSVNGDTEAQSKAEEIAGNVRSIMLNEGGPVAARTLYPILRDNVEALGYMVAIEPADITVAAIREVFDFVPMGIPAPDWPDGSHATGTVNISAEATCLGCHNTAAVGDTLGTVTVRNYLSRDIALWWKSVQLGAGLALGKILLHSVLLFILLRSRMQPLLQLRSVVSRLARAFGALDSRAEVRSRDEFGVLASDLNLFLDRISRLIGELDTVLRRVVQVNDDVIRIQGSLRDRVKSFSNHTRQIERRALVGAKREPLLSPEWFDAMQNSIRELDNTLAARSDTAIGPVFDQLRAVIGNAEAQINANQVLFEDVAKLGSDSDDFQEALTEMIRLEERLGAIIESGTGLVSRLQGKGKAAEGEATEGETA